MTLRRGLFLVQPTSLHATAERVLAAGASAVSPLEAATNSPPNSRRNLMISPRSFHRGPAFWIGTADAAKGGRDKRRWLAQFGNAKLLVKPVVDEPVSVTAFDVVRALAALDPAGFGLDDACAQLEGSTYVMAEEARRIVWY